MNRLISLTVAGAGLWALMVAARAEAAPLTLAEAVQHALEIAPSVEGAVAASELSAAKVREQRAPLLPSMSAGTEYYQAPGYNEVVTNRGLSAAMLALTYTAWDGGQREANLRAARYASEAATLGISAERAQIVYNATAAYYQLARARGAERELQASLDRLRRYVLIVEQLRRTGRAIDSDVLKIESARDATELELSAARGERERASATLASMMGNFGQSDLEIAEPAGVPPRPGGDIDSTPAMQAAHRAVSAATSEVKASEAERMPTLKFAVTTGFLGVDPPSTVGHNFGGSYDGVVSLPIYDGGLIRSHIDHAKARQHAALAQLREVQYLIRRRIDDASLRYDQALDALTIAERAVSTADDSFALAWTRFLGGGTATMLDLVDTYQQAERLRLARFDQQYAAREAAAEIALLYGSTEAR